MMIIQFEGMLCHFLSFNINKSYPSLDTILITDNAHIDHFDIRNNFSKHLHYILLFHALSKISYEQCPLSFSSLLYLFPFISLLPLLSFITFLTISPFTNYFSLLFFLAFLFA